MVRRLWSRRVPDGDGYRDVFEIEAVGPALILYNFGHLFPPDAMWMHYIDNESALAALVRGSSSVMSGECITAYTHQWIAHYGLRSWFDRVDSAANPVDKLSRGEFKGDWELLPIVFTPDLLEAITAFVAHTGV